MNENDLYVVKECKFDKPLITEIDSMKGGCYGDCHNKFFQSFKDECIYDIELTKITKNEKIKLTISGKNMNLYDLNKKFKDARHNGLTFDQINKLTMKNYSHLRYINISFYLKFRTPMCHRHFLG